jgi:hypothetical protein
VSSSSLTLSSGVAGIGFWGARRNDERREDEGGGDEDLEVDIDTDAGVVLIEDDEG